MSDDDPTTEILAALQRLEGGQAKLVTDQEATEARLMGRINTLQEQMLERFRGVDISLTAINQTLTAYGEMMRNTNLLLNMLVTGYGDHGKRITDLEGKP